MLPNEGPPRSLFVFLGLPPSSSPPRLSGLMNVYCITPRLGCMVDYAAKHNSILFIPKPLSQDGVFGRYPQTFNTKGDTLSHD